MWYAHGCGRSGTTNRGWGGASYEGVVGVGLRLLITLLLPASAACAAFDPTGLIAGGASELDFSRESS